MLAMTSEIGDNCVLVIRNRMECQVAKYDLRNLDEFETAEEAILQYNVHRCLDLMTFDWSPISVVMESVRDIYHEDESLDHMSTILKLREKDFALRPSADKHWNWFVHGIDKGFKAIAETDWDNIEEAEILFRDGMMGEGPDNPFEYAIANRMAALLSRAMAPPRYWDRDKPSTLSTDGHTELKRLVGLQWEMCQNILKNG